MSADADLPPLPEYAHAFRPRWDGDIGGFTEQQMRLFRSEGVAAAQSEIAQLRTALRTVANAHAWREFGECRAYGADLPMLSPSEVDAVARRALGMTAVATKEQPT